MHELIPLWTLAIFFVVYAFNQLGQAVHELGMGYTKRGEKFSVRRGLTLLTYHVSDAAVRNTVLCCQP